MPRIATVLPFGFVMRADTAVATAPASSMNVSALSFTSKEPLV